MDRATTSTIITIRYAETDQMGLVHHSMYPVYFEAGRTDFFAEHLVPYIEMERQGLLAPVVECHLRLEGQARYPEQLEVITRPRWLRGIRLAMEYAVFRVHDRAAVADGYTVHALLGRDLAPAHPRRFGTAYELLQRHFPRT